MDISAHAFFLADRPLWAIWVTSVRMRREDRSSISSHPLADLGGNGTMSSFSPDQVAAVFMVPPLAASMGRIRLPCSTAGDGRVVAATRLTCALNRGYVREEVRDLIMDLNVATAQRFSGSQVTTLEGNL